MNPSSTTAGGAAFTLMVTGSNFISSSTVLWNGSARTTTFVSSTSLQANITAADIATAGTGAVTVSNPAPGGGTSTPLTFAIDNPVPTVSTLNPNALVAGSAGFTLTVTGTNFVSSSSLLWNGNGRTTTVVSSTSLQAAVTAADVATAGTAMVTVTNPAPGGGTASAASFTIQFPPPAITLLNPSSAIADGAAFTLNVAGTNFLPSSTIQWDGSARVTTFVSSTSLQASITAADISAIGAAKVTVANPPGSGGTSAASSFFVGSSGGANYAVITVNQAAKDIVFDSVNDVFYLSVTGTDPTVPNTISVLDPSTGKITSSAPAGSDPDVLAISDDSQFLYAGIDGTGAVQRFALPDLTKDISYSLGGTPNIALELVVSPGGPHTTAVALGNPNSSPAAEGITIFDDATPRPTKAQNATYSSIQWGSDATTLFSSNGEGSGFDFYILSVSSTGVSLNQDFGNMFSGYGNKIHFDRGAKLIYGDFGQVVDPNGVSVGVFDSSPVFNASPSVMTPDSVLGTAFFVGQTSEVGGTGTFTIQSYDLAHYQAISSISLTGLTGGNPVHLIRWAQNGLAFNTSGGQVILLAGNFVSPAPPLNLAPPPTPATPPVPAPNAPTITSLTPSSAIAGGLSLPINIAGTNFNSASTVQFNGNALTTTFVSSSQLTAAVAAADIFTAGTASITVANPSASGGVSAASPFFIGTTGGTSSAGTGFAVTALNQASNDIAFDAAHQLIYLSVPGTVPSLGNTVAVLDPTSTKIVGEQFAGSNPHLLAISSDSQFLYAGIDGAASVRRFTLPGLGIDVSYSLGADSFLGPFTALDLQVAPGAPHTTAVTLANIGFSPSATGGITIFDDTTARPAKAPGLGGASGGLFDSLQWGPDATTLYAANGESSGFDFYTLSVAASGVSLNHDYPGAADGTRIHFDAGSNLVTME